MHAASPDLVSRYFDHGATSFPKPAVVARRVAEYIDSVGGTYGRAAYGQAHRASAIVFEARERLARLIGAHDSARVAFTQNATCALNIAVQGAVRDGGTVLVSPLEHNSVMRPLSLMTARRGVRVEVLPHGPDGVVDPERIAPAEGACLAVCLLQSNVNGARQPIAEIKRRLGTVPLLVDAAQGGGEIPIDVERDRIDMLALTGHKGLLGPTGTGALYVREGLDLPPLTPGGTGSRSESTEQPTAMPDSLEGGTPNIAGIAGLGAALAFVGERGPGRGAELAAYAIDRMRDLDGVALLTAADPERQGSLFSFEVRSLACSDVAHRLHEGFGIAVRAGLHCAPAAHRCLGTFERGGAVRAAFGRFQTEEDVDRLVRAVDEAARGR